MTEASGYLRYVGFEDNKPLQKSPAHAGFETSHTSRRARAVALSELLARPPGDPAELNGGPLVPAGVTQRRVLAVHLKGLITNACHK